MSDGPSTRNRRITRTCFHICSTYRSYSQAPLYPCALRTIADRAEGAFALLRYLLGGDRPSQTAHIALFLTRITGQVRMPTKQGWYFKGDSTKTGVPVSMSPTYPTHTMLAPNTMLQ